MYPYQVYLLISVLFCLFVNDTPKMLKIKIKTFLKLVLFIFQFGINPYKTFVSFNKINCKSAHSIVQSSYVPQ